MLLKNNFKKTQTLKKKKQLMFQIERFLKFRTQKSIGHRKLQSIYEKIKNKPFKILF